MNYQGNCIYCGKYVTREGKNNRRNIRVRQCGKYGRTLFAHYTCYMKQTRGQMMEKE